MEYEVKTFECIDRVKAVEWDKVSTIPFTKHACLKAIEKLDTICIVPRYIVVLEDERIVATVAAYIQTDAEYATLEKSIFGKYYKLFRTLFLRLNPCLLCYIPLGTIFKSIEVCEHANNKENIY